MSGPESTESLQYHLRRMADVAADQIDADRLSRAADQIDTRAPVEYAALPEVQALIAGAFEAAAQHCEQWRVDALMFDLKSDATCFETARDEIRALTPADAIAARDAIAAEAVAKEREACAELAASSTVPAQTAMRLAAAIRKRGEGQP